MSAVADALASVVCPVTPNVPATPRRNAGDVVPIPTLPEDSTVRNDALEEEATVKIGLVCPPVPTTERSDVGVELPIPRRVLVLSQKKLALFCDTSPPVVINGIDPVVSPER